MKNLTLLLIFLNMGILLGQNPKSIITDCSPGVKTIYDFQAGDYFRYFYDIEFGAGDATYYKIDESYSIIERIETNNTIWYVRKGKYTEWKKGHCFGCYPYGPADKTTYIINDTIMVMDSINHFLNKCPGELFNFAGNFLHPASGDDPYYTQIKMVQKDNLTCKSVGGENNCYSLDSTGQIVDTLNSYDMIMSDSYFWSFQEIYSPGLGMIEKSEGGFEYGYHKWLVGYIKGNDTIGDISSIPTYDPQISSFALFPNPVADNLTVSLGVPAEKISLYSLAGTLLFQTALNGRKNITIPLQDLKNGIYVIEVSGKVRMLKKFVKISP